MGKINHAKCRPKDNYNCGPGLDYLAQSNRTGPILHWIS